MCFVFKLQATQQIPDILIFEGDTFSFLASPLELLYQNGTKRPVILSKNDESISSCWRNYQAEWTISNDQLYLTAIFSCDKIEDRTKLDMTKLFPEKYSMGKVNADWVTSNSISLNDDFYTTYGDYPTLEEKDLGFEFIQGRVIETFKISQKVNQINYYIYNNINWELLPKESDTIKVIIEIKTNINGVFDSLNILNGYDGIYNNEAIKVIEQIPDKKTYYRNLVLVIVFSSDNRKKYHK